jgi:multiple sugar transport system ATP-binding protein
MPGAWRGIRGEWSAMATVDLVGVSKSYGGNRPAVRDVSLHIESGEFIALVGPSGCGKSSLLRMIAGLEELTSGSIRIGGADVRGVAPKNRDVAMVFQNYALYPHFSVYENLAFALKLRKLSVAEIERKVAATAGLLGLTDYLQRRPRELSGGERQRVALGRAMVRDPQVFLFDEPLSNLDAKLRVQMRAEIKRLHQRVRATMIYVTHDQVEAMTLGERIAVMNAGVLQQVADPYTIYRHPNHRFVAEFLGTPPINLFRARVSADGARLEVDGLTLDLPAAAAIRVGPARGRSLDVGVRPEHVRTPPSGAGTLDAEVDVLEPLGSETLVHWKTRLGPLVSRVEGDRVPALGDRAALQLDWDAAHFFDAESQRSLDVSSDVPAAHVV